MVVLDHFQVILDHFKWENPLVFDFSSQFSSSNFCFKITQRVINFDFLSSLRYPGWLLKCFGPFPTQKTTCFCLFGAIFDGKCSRFCIFVQNFSLSLSSLDPKRVPNKVGTSKKDRLTPQVHPKAILKPNFMPFWSKTDPFLPDLDFSSQICSQISSQIFRFTQKVNISTFYSSQSISGSFPITFQTI